MWLEHQFQVTQIEWSPSDWVYKDSPGVSETRSSQQLEELSRSYPWCSQLPEARKMLNKLAVACIFAAFAVLIFPLIQGKNFFFFSVYVFLMSIVNSLN